MPTQHPYTFYNPEEPLPEILVKRASKELGEVQGQVGAHLESFRRWLSSMPHLKCRTGYDAFLLAFLRHAKFNHSKAQKRLDNFCTFRTSESVGAPLWFNYEQDRLDIFMDFDDLRARVHSRGCALYAAESRLVCRLRLCQVCLGEWAKWAASPQELYKAWQTWDDVFLCDERAQIGGIAFIMDLEGMSKRDFMKFQDPRASKLSTMYLQILMLQKDLTPAYESVPGLEELMPAEYNGGNCSFEEICVRLLYMLLSLEKNIKEFSKIPKNYLDFGISVDEAKRPSNSKNLMRVYKDLSPELMGISGNYVKIEDEI
ncbi:unnamed protein product [Schistocephalus solidus]|uniref:CRAL_TRIO_N domain-containing protein n=1 Tax=Schistocephalus solidus TaxID=70667 RepID=A0A183TKP2_SCHSO|nr:unnamed protein product [Schistocephalus solidus]